MDVSGSSSCIVTTQEPVSLDGDPYHRCLCGQWLIKQMNSPV
jgi:hypothetical protein